MLKAKAVALLSVLLIGRFALATTGPVVFSDSFDADASGLHITSLANWTVVNPGGSVDVLNHKDFGLPCVGSTGRCLDLDGSTSAAADLVSTPLALGPGIYTLSYQLAGSQRGDTNTVEVFFGGVFLRIVTLSSSAPYATFSDVVTLPSSTSGSIEFRHSGGDYRGLLLDNVSMAMSSAGTNYIDVATIADVNGDGALDQAVLTLSANNYFLKTVDGATGKLLKQVALGAAAAITPGALSTEGTQISVLITRSTGVGVLQLRDNATLVLVKTLTLPK